MKRRISNSYLQEIILSIIIVTHNNENTIGHVLKNIHKIFSRKYPNYEFIIIDNNSEDKTVEKIKKIYNKIPSIRIIKLAKAYSLELAYTAGLDNCIGDYAILCNPAIQPSFIPQVLDTAFHSYDIVSLRPKQSLSIRRIVLSALEILSQNKFSYEPIYLLVFTRKVINSFTKMRRKSRNFIYLGNAMGYSRIILEEPSISIEESGENIPNLFVFFYMVIDIIISNSFKPLRLLVALGIVISLGFSLYTGSILGGLFFLLFCVLAMIAEYIIRILDETRNDPLYFIADEMDKSIMQFDKKKINIM